MADLTIRVPVRSNWIESDHVQLFIGTENAADLAASTPAGGTKVNDQSARPGNVQGGFGQGQFGAGPFGGAHTVVIKHTYRSTDKCASLPIGVKVVDQAGNVSAVYETVKMLADPPRGARGLAIAATANTNEAKLSWTASPDI